LIRSSAEDSLGYRIAELFSAIMVLRKKPELGELCFRVYYPGEDINLYKSELENEAGKYGYNIYFKSGKVGTTLGMLEYIAAKYWE
jgi:hypothetical protein